MSRSDVRIIVPNGFGLVFFTCPVPPGRVTLLYNKFPDADLVASGDAFCILTGDHTSVQGMIDHVWAELYRRGIVTQNKSPEPETLNLSKLGKVR